MNKFRIAAVICAAGSSSRMPAQNKLLLDYKQTTFIGQITKQLIATELRPIIVITGFESQKIEEALSAYAPQVTFVNNPLYQSGHTSSIQAALEVLPLDLDAFMINLGDMPMITTVQYDEQVDHFKKDYAKGKHLITRPMNEKTPGHPVIFSNSLRSAIMSCTTSDGCKSVIKEYRDYLSPYFTEDHAYFTDIDTPSDYQNMKATITAN